jgi:fucose permease
VASAGNVLLGALLFSITAYVPMYGQGVLGGTAMDAGIILAPILIGWPIASTVAGWLLMRVGYRAMSVGGAVFSVAGSLLLVHAGATTSRLEIMAAMLMIGIGLGLLSMPYLLGVQIAVPWHRRGVATSSVQFFRNIGGAVAVAALGALLNARLQTIAGPGADANAVLEPSLRAGIDPATLQRLTSAMLHGLQAVFIAFVVLAVVSLGVALIFPRGSAREQMYREEENPVTET